VTRRLLLTYLALTIDLLAALEIPLALNYQDRLEAEITANLQRDAFVIASFSEETAEGAANADLGPSPARTNDTGPGRIATATASRSPIRTPSAPTRTSPRVGRSSPRRSPARPARARATPTP
jgi:hypothetical protein